MNANLNSLGTATNVYIAIAQDILTIYQRNVNIVMEENHMMLDIINVYEKCK